MLIRKIQLKNFMRYDSLDLALPERGVILVTGVNGSGKSSLQEAVSVALWGKTLRKTPPWRQGVEGSAIVETADLTVTRKATKKGAPSLSFLVGDQSFDRQKYNTLTKAQAALDSRIMPWDLWRRTHVFSPSMAANFTTAKDSKRKRLIESFLGLEMFDHALVLCRADLKDARIELSQLDREISTLDGRIAIYQQQREDAVLAIETAEQILAQEIKQVDGAPTEEEVKVLEQSLADVREALQDSQSDLTEIASRFRDIELSVSDAETRLRMANEREGDLANVKCPTCGQDIPKEQREAVAEKLQNLRSHVVDMRQKAENEQRILQANRNDLTEEVELLRERSIALSTDIRVARAKIDEASSKEIKEKKIVAKRNLQQANDRLEKIFGTVSRLNGEMDALKTRQIDVQKRLEFLEVVEKVLGLRGVRVQVLARAVAGINDLASYWLAQITNNPDAGIQLKPYSETKTAGVTDALSLDITGFGGGYGYLAASSGERRRIDVPITMALATVADAALGVSQGTLWMDEIFDNLDDFGVEAVSGALEELGQERPVVVISHSLKMVEQLKPALHIHVDAGKISIKS